MISEKCVNGFHALSAIVKPAAISDKNRYTVKSAYKEPAYKELPVIRNRFSFPNLYQKTSLLYVYKELRL